MSPRSVAIVPHTHWDREWYEPYQTFRYHLVELLDTLLPLMEEDPSYAHFLLDGQLAVVDDYLEVRPEAEERIRGLAAAGRLSMGPWYILLDEFLVSAETIVRDLQMGLARGAAFGGTMDVGYLPDMFGHVAQMPQILRLAGFNHAVVWRGVPSEITATGFTWEALDGSSVRAELLPVGYGNGASLPDDAKALVRRVTDLEAEIGSFLIGPMLLMNGSDHLRPQPALGRTVAEANALQDDYRLEITSLPEYLAQAPTEGLQRWRGELRSGARANVLMGVTSNRVDVKRAAAAAERAIERRAEPYAARFFDPGAWPTRLLQLAWRELVRNAAHDSICACSVDDVVDAVLHRYHEARAIGEAIAEDALRTFGRSMATAGPVVVNPSAGPRSGLVELAISEDEAVGAGVPANVQVVSERTSLPRAMTLDADTMRTVLGMLQGPQIDNDRFIQSVDVREDETGIDVVLTIGTEERPGLAISEAKQDIYTRLGARPDVAVRVRMDQPTIRRVVAKVAEVAGFGWQAFEPVAPAHPVTVDESTASGAAVPEAPAPESTAGVTLSNGLVTVVVDAETGTFSLDGLPGFGRLVDGGDLGDSYNYSPPAHDRFVEEPETGTVSVGEPGPLRASAVIAATYRWPDHVDPRSGERVGEQLVTVTTTVEVHADDPVVRVVTHFINPARDHRLRVHLPLPEPATRSEAECAFAVVERGLEAEGRRDERGLPTFPARRFVRAGGLTVTHDGVTEYELIDMEPDSGGARSAGGPAGPEGQQARTLALAVLRSTGMLSGLGMAYRPFPAGPLTHVEGLQLTGKPITFRYALCRQPVDPWTMADQHLLPLEVVQAPGGGWRGRSGSDLTVEGAVVTALRRVDGLVEVRVCNPTPEPTIVRVDAGPGWLVDLRGAPLEPFDGAFPLRPFGIATFRLPATA